MTCFACDLVEPNLCTQHEAAFIKTEVCRLASERDALKAALESLVNAPYAPTGGTWDRARALLKEMKP